MTCRERIKRRYFPLIALFLCVFVGHVTQATADQRVRGFYEVTQTVDLGSQVRVFLRLRLINRGDGTLFIQCLTLRSFSPAPERQAHSVSVLLRPHASEVMTQEFTISHSEYELWLRGVRPRLVLEMQSSDQNKLTEAIQLDRLPNGAGR